MSLPRAVQRAVLNLSPGMSGAKTSLVLYPLGSNNSSKQLPGKYGYTCFSFGAFLMLFKIGLHSFYIKNFHKFDFSFTPKLPRCIQD